MDLFQAVGMTGKFFQFVMKFLFQRDVNLVGPFGDYWDDPLSVFYEKIL